MPKTHLQLPELLNIVGRSPAAMEVDAWLSGHRIHSRPYVFKDGKKSSGDRDSAQRDAKASEIDEVERHSLALIYDPKPLYRAMAGKPAGLVGEDPGDFVLREVALFGPGVQHYRGFADALPFGLAFGQSGTQAERAMGAPWARRTVHELHTDLWAREGWIVNASYLHGDRDLGLVHIRRPHVFDRRMLGLEAPMPPAQRAAWEPLVHSLGQSGTSDQVRLALAAIGWDPDLFELSEDGEITHYLQAKGVTLYFGGHGHAPSTLTGIRLNRLGDMRSAGYDGQLPFGIEFHTQPDALAQLVGRGPDRISQAPDTGAFLWHLDAFDLHVMYSLIDVQVYRVSLFLPSR